jgi:predicted transcriptional regulator
MDLINELGNELALSFLVEKKFTEKIPSSEVPFLIDKIKDALQAIQSAEKAKSQTAAAIQSISH